VKIARYRKRKQYELAEAAAKEERQDSGEHVINDSVEFEESSHKKPLLLDTDPLVNYKSTKD